MVTMQHVFLFLALFTTCRLDHTKDRRLLLHSDVDINQALTELRRDINATKQDNLDLRRELNATQQTQKAQLEQEIKAQKTQFELEINAAKQENLAQKAQLEQEINATKKDSLAQKAQMEQEIGTLKAEVAQLRKRQGSTYVRWGRTTCSANDTEKVYSGFAAGSHYYTAGGAASTICLPDSPSWAYYVDGEQDIGGKIYGTEYQSQSGSFSHHAFGEIMDDQNVPCALCHSSRPASVMIPGSTSCYQGWTLEYTGYLMTNHYTFKGVMDYVCVDNDPEAVYQGGANTDGHLLYFTEVQCGTLPCQEYPQGRELACVVCSK